MNVKLHYVCIKLELIPINNFQSMENYDTRLKNNLNVLFNKSNFGNQIPIIKNIKTML